MAILVAALSLWSLGLSGVSPLGGDLAHRDDMTPHVAHLAPAIQLAPIRRGPECPAPDSFPETCISEDDDEECEETQYLVAGAMPVTFPPLPPSLTKGTASGHGLPRLGDASLPVIRSVLMRC